MNEFNKFYKAIFLLLSFTLFLVFNISCYAQIIVGFTYSQVCLGDSTTITSTTSTTNGNITNIVWDLDQDGKFDDATGNKFSWYYNFMGSHLVGQKVYTSTGDSAFKYSEVNIFNKPEAKFSVRNRCLNEVTEFVNQSKILNDIITTAFWDLGDGSTDTLMEDMYNTYETAGLYNVSLIVGTKSGCYDTVINPIQIYNAPSITILNSPDSVGYVGDIISLSIDSTLYEDIQWSTGSVNADIQVNTSSIYSVEVTDSNGCVSVSYRNVHFLEEGEMIVPSLITPNSDGYNDNWVIEYANIYGTIEVYIYNNQGVKVFESLDYQNDFNGISNGDLLSRGDYVYIIKTSKGEVHKGSLGIFY